MATTLDRASAGDRETGELTPVDEERADFPDARLNPKFIQVRSGRPFVSYPGLLDLLHQLSDGYFAVDTEVVQLPAADNGHTAVCIARVRIFDPQDADVVRRLTTGIGDADPSNVSSQMRPHLLRMAETRAKARALRDAVNVGMAALEELGPDEQEKAPVPRAVSLHEPEGITIEGTRFTRPQVEAAFRKRLAEARQAGLVAQDVETMPIGQTPLPILVGLMQDWKRRLAAKGGSTGK